MPDDPKSSGCKRVQHPRVKINNVQSKKKVGKRWKSKLRKPPAKKSEGSVVVVVAVVGVMVWLLESSESAPKPNKARDTRHRSRKRAPTPTSLVSPPTPLEQMASPSRPTVATRLVSRLVYALRSKAVNILITSIPASRFLGARSGYNSNPAHGINSFQLPIGACKNPPPIGFSCCAKLRFIAVVDPGDEKVQPAISVDSTTY